MGIVYAFLLGFALMTAILSVEHWVRRLAAVAYIAALIIVHSLAKSEFYVSDQLEAMTLDMFWQSEKVYYATLGAVVGALICVVSEHHLSQYLPLPVKRVLFARYRRTSAAPSSTALMGTATRNFVTHELDVQTETVIRLSAYVFGGLTRQLVSTIETNVRPTAAQRGAVETLIAESFHTRPPLRRIIKQYRRSGSGYNDAHGLFSTLCTVVAQSGEHDRRAVQSLAVVGKALDLNRTELQAHFERARVVA